MADQKPAVKFIKLTPLSLRKDYKDNNDKDDYGLLAWSIRAGYPRINVYTSNSNKQPNAKFNYDTFITAPFDYVTFGILMDRIEKVIASKDEIKYTIDCNNIKFENGVKTNTIYLQAKVHVGRDKEGVIFIAAIEEGKRKLKFYLMPSDKWFVFYDDLNNIITDKRILSTLYAKSYLDLLKSIMSKEAYTDMVKQNTPVPVATARQTTPPSTSNASNIDFTSSIEELL
jgi:hypothetical protein